MIKRDTILTLNTCYTCTSINIAVFFLFKMTDPPFHSDRCPQNTLRWPSFFSEPPATVWFGFTAPKHSQSCFCQRKVHYKCHLLLILSDIEASCAVCFSPLGLCCAALLSLTRSQLALFVCFFVLWVIWQNMVPLYRAAVFKGFWSAL